MLRGRGTGSWRLVRSLNPLICVLRHGDFEKWGNPSDATNTRLCECLLLLHYITVKFIMHMLNWDLKCFQRMFSYGNFVDLFTLDFNLEFLYPKNFYS